MDRRDQMEMLDHQDLPDPRGQMETRVHQENL